MNDARQIALLERMVALLERIAEAVEDQSGIMLSAPETDEDDEEERPSWER